MFISSSLSSSTSISLSELDSGPSIRNLQKKQNSVRMIKDQRVKYLSSTYLVPNQLYLCNDSNCNNPLSDEGEKKKLNFNKMVISFSWQINDLMFKTLPQTVYYILWSLHSGRNLVFCRTRDRGTEIQKLLSPKNKQYIFLGGWLVFFFSSPITLSHKWIIWSTQWKQLQFSMRIKATYVTKIRAGKVINHRNYSFVL